MSGRGFMVDGSGRPVCTVTHHRDNVGNRAMTPGVIIVASRSGDGFNLRSEMVACQKCIDKLKSQGFTIEVK